MESGLRRQDQILGRQVDSRGQTINGKISLFIPKYIQLLNNVNYHHLGMQSCCVLNGINQTDSHV